MITDQQLNEWKRLVDDQINYISDLDSTFTVEARTALPQLIAEVERLRSAVEKVWGHDRRCGYPTPKEWMALVNIATAALEGAP